MVRRKPIFSLASGNELSDIVMVIRIDKLFTYVNEREHESLYAKADVSWSQPNPHSTQTNSPLLGHEKRTR